MDSEVGLVLMRLALGPMLVVHGANKVWGSGGLTGTTQWFDTIGLRPAAWHARLAAATEILAGLLMTLGLLTTAAASAYVGLMTVAIWTDHRGKGYFVFKGGYEYALLVGMVAVSLAALGSGDWSLDALIGLDLTGPLWAATAAVVGLGAAMVLLALCYRPAPKLAPSSES